MMYPTLSLCATLAFSSASLAAVLQTEQKNVALAVDNGNLPSFTQDPEMQIVNNEIQGARLNPENPEGRAAAPQGARVLAAAGWTATADSQEGDVGGQYGAAKAIDNNANTFWHTPFGANGKGFPHFITIDMKQIQLINSLSYQPRQDGKANGNIGDHEITTSKDCVRFTPPFVLGRWRDDQSTKFANFEAHNARCVRLTALSEGAKPQRGPWTSVAEINIYTTNTPSPAYGGIGGGKWSPSIDFPIVPVAAALEHTSGDVLTWSAYSASQFGGSAGKQTLTARFHANTMRVDPRTITNTNHDMFCPAINMDSQGRPIVTGGNTSGRMSIFVAPDWIRGPDTAVTRGYAASTLMSDGQTFLIGGSWSGDQGNKVGEIYNPGTQRWTRLAGAKVEPLYTNDPADAANNEVYRRDNHAWLFGWKNGYVFQAGPSRAMNWYNPTGAGSVKNAGNRGNDGDAMCGNAVMYDAVAGKILAVGGSVAYQDRDSTANAHIITLGNPNVNPGVQQINPMWYRRIFASAVVLPNADVVIIGGQVYGKPFSDATAQLTPELWQASTTRFIKLPPINAPRVYHSVALLLADGQVFQGGGGLCGDCDTNHFDAQVYAPGYLFNADGSRATRPVINSVNKNQFFPGDTLTVNTNGGVASWSLVRVGSVTHTVNTDQRRVPLTARANGNTYTMTTPGDPGILLPGYYMLFAMSAQGTPSISKFVRVQAKIGG